MIYIYTDNIHPHAYIHIALTEIFPNMAIRFCNASMVIDGCLRDAKLLIMPGGADLYYCEKLNGHGNQIIREFVENGGSYLGLCAGAYYGCSALDWNKGEIDGERELAFTQATATGPVYEWLEKPNAPYDGSWLKSTSIQTDNNDEFLTQYNGGPVFHETGNDTVIARYSELENHPPAIIGGQFGKGQYILSSPHIENYGHIADNTIYKHLNNSYNREKAEIDKLLTHTEIQKEFFKSIIKRLL